MTQEHVVTMTADDVNLITAGYNALHEMRRIDDPYKQPNRTELQYSALLDRLRKAVWGQKHVGEHNHSSN